MTFVCPEDRHEVGVAVPAGHDVPVEMSGEAGTGGLALVQPDIITLRAEHPIEDQRHPAQDLDRLDEVGPFEFPQRPPMDARGHEQMPVIIRVTIEHDDRVGAAEHEEVVAVAVVGEPLAEEAPAGGLRRGGGLVDVLRAPGGPDPTQHDIRSRGDGGPGLGPGRSAMEQSLEMPTTRRRPRSRSGEGPADRRCISLWRKDVALAMPSLAFRRAGTVGECPGRRRCRRPSGPPVETVGLGECEEIGRTGSVQSPRHPERRPSSGS